MNGLPVKIVTPKGVFLEREADEALIDSTNGPLGILPQHTNMIFRLPPRGKLALKIGDENLSLVVEDGFAEVHNGKVLVVASSVNVSD